MAKQGYVSITIQELKKKRLERIAEDILNKQQVKTDRKRELSSEYVIDVLATAYEQRKAMSRLNERV